MTYRLLADAQWQKTRIIIPKTMGLSPAPTASSGRDTVAKNVFTCWQLAVAQVVENSHHHPNEDGFESCSNCFEWERYSGKNVLTYWLLAEAQWQKTRIIIPKRMGLSPAPTASSGRDIVAKNVLTHRQSAEAQ